MHPLEVGKQPEKSSLKNLSLENSGIDADNRNGMFHKEMLGLIVQVMQSWQVLIITIALILYMCLVNYVARTYHRPHFVSKSKPKKAAKKAVAAAMPEQVESDDEDALIG